MCSVGQWQAVLYGGWDHSGEPVRLQIRGGQADNLTIHDADSGGSKCHLSSEMTNHSHDNAFDGKGIDLFHENRLESIVRRM